MAGKVTENDGWTTVSEDEVDESKIVFEAIGDAFIGTYLGTRVVPNADGNYTQARFRGEDGGTYFVNANYSLTKGLAEVRPGKMTRITYVDEKDVGQQSPLRIFRVDVKR